MGQIIDRDHNVGSDQALQNVYQNIYTPIAKPNHSKDVVDRVTEIFGVITDFLKNDSNYKSLQDYISYAP